MPLAWYTGALPRTLLGRTTVHLWPKWLIPVSPAQVAGIGEVRLYQTFAEWADAHRPRSLCFVRTHALGDIIMLVAVCRALRRLMGLTGRVTILVNRKYLEDLQGERADPDIAYAAYSVGRRDWGADVHFVLNKALEGDHLGGADSEMHRVDLYAKALGLECAA